MNVGPSWLYHLFALAMLVVAAYCLTLLAFSLKERRLSGWDVDLAHVVMGVAMAGMFITSWAFGPAWAWQLIFFTLMVWFMARSIQSLQEFGFHLPHFAIHALMSFAMLMMFVFPGDPGGGTSVSMAMSTHAGTRLDPGVAFLLAFTFFASAIFTLASDRKGIAHHGTHAPAGTVMGEPDRAGVVTGSPAGDGAVAVVDTPVGVIERIVATHWLEDASHVVMCVAMGLMLILMI